MGSDWVTDTVCEEPMVFTDLAGPCGFEPIPPNQFSEAEARSFLTPAHPDRMWSAPAVSRNDIFDSQGVMHH